MLVNYWLDPLCPWCWMTSRWIVEVAPQRDLDIQWRPISLKLKNDPPPESPNYGAVTASLKLLRVMEAVRTTEGNGPIGDLYTEFGTRIHGRQDLFFDPADALTAAGLDPVFAQAADDESWDDAIAADMAVGLALTGDDVGTPLIGFKDTEGNDTAIFGPVISRFLEPEEGLRLWDAVFAMGSIPGFWELKRTRTEDPAETFRF